MKSSSWCLTSFKCSSMFRKLDESDDKFIHSKLKRKSCKLIMSQEGSTGHSLAVLFWWEFRKRFQKFLFWSKILQLWLNTTHKTSLWYFYHYLEHYKHLSQHQTCAIWNWIMSNFCLQVRSQLIPDNHMIIQMHNRTNTFSQLSGLAELDLCVITTKRASARRAQLGALASEKLLDHTDVGMSSCFGKLHAASYTSDTGKADAAAVFH